MEKNVFIYRYNGHLGLLLDVDSQLGTPIRLNRGKNIGFYTLEQLEGLDLTTLAPYKAYIDNESYSYSDGAEVDVFQFEGHGGNVLTEWELVDSMKVPIYADEGETPIRWGEDEEWIAYNPNRADQYGWRRLR